MDPRSAGLKTAEDSGFSRAIKIRSTPPYVVKFYGMIKNPSKYERQFVRKNS
jgi:hypothetical protein